jgi:hypothetical protein
MRDIVLIYDNASNWLAKSEAERNAVFAKHMAFSEMLRAQDAMEGGDELQPTGSAMSVRTQHGGGVAVTHGPFAETREQLGGYYIVKAKDMAQALEWAKQLPIETGTVEVRPLTDM